MEVVLVQAPYPSGQNAGATADCVQWMLDAVEEIPADDADLIVLPEYANCPGLPDARSIREFAGGAGEEFTQTVRKAASERNAMLCMNRVVAAGSAAWVNRTELYARDGELAGRYDKTHLTDTELAKAGLTPGPGHATAAIDGVVFGFSACLDLYFSEYFAGLACLAPDVVFCPAYQRSESPARIRLLSQARALDTGAWLLRCSYSTGDSERGGHSLVAAPDGSIRGDQGTEPGLLRLAIDPHARFRKPGCHGAPAVEHRELLRVKRRASIGSERARFAIRVDSSPLPRVCAHRGLSAACPENTLPAFAAAMGAGAHELELDLWLCRDGVPVVCHDANLARTTGVDAEIADASWADIRRLDAGSTKGDHWRGVSVPRFEEVLDMVGGRCGLNLHIKETGPENRLIEIVCGALVREGVSELAYIAGDEEVLRACRAIAPDIRLACLADADRPAVQVDTARRYGCDRVQFGRNATRENIATAHRAGMMVNLFWSDEPDDALAWLTAGVDVILSNQPQVLFAAGTARPFTAPTEALDGE